jgi:predicted GIY-YIG superfamily endonuclease
VTTAVAAIDDWSVYIVRCADGTLYTGTAKDLVARVAEHNAGRGAKYTRGRAPVTLVYREPAGDRAAALRREYEIKRLPAGAKRRLIASAGL